jgi:hypothetical protein
MAITYSKLKEIETRGKMSGAEIRKHFGLPSTTNIENSSIRPYLVPVLDVPGHYELSPHWQSAWATRHGGT